jgi:predicted MPP superfamily phosphohydrolase
MANTRRRPRNYSRLMHARERALAVLCGRGWPANVARWMGMPTKVGVREVAFTQERVAHPPLRIAFASDLHAGPVTHPSLLRHACETLAAMRADVVLWGGDFVCLDARHIDQVIDHMAAVRAPGGSYAVLGNHDLWVDFNYIERRLEQAGVQVLTNRNARLPAPFDQVWVCGLDDAQSGNPDVRAAFAGARGVRIVLMHAPDGMLEIGMNHFDVGFCGHTHGGQIALPGGTPVMLPNGRLNRRFARGVHALEGQRHLVVSLGVGYSTVPFRAFAPPEVVRCTLTSEKK